MDRAEALKARIAELEAALTFYAAEESWQPSVAGVSWILTDIEWDRGKVAQAALDGVPSAASAWRTHLPAVAEAELLVLGPATEPLNAKEGESK